MAATGTPVRDMWLGPLGLMHRMAERGAWERTPALGTELHTSLHGQVTASRSRWAVRTTSLSWDRLERRDADALVEMSTVHARADATINVIDPDATNLLGPEQSRGRPVLGELPAAVSDLYLYAGAGQVTVGLVSGVRYACTQDAAAGDVLTWMHPYYGARGWPVLPGWPVYLRGATAATAIGAGQLQLDWRNWAGTIISSTTGTLGSGEVDADAPADAATVTPRLIVGQPLSSLWLVGQALLSYQPPAPGVWPLGNGCPVYAVTGVTDTPHLPYRSVRLNLQEVRALAVR